MLTLDERSPIQPPGRGKWADTSSLEMPKVPYDPLPPNEYRNRPPFKPTNPPRAVGDAMKQKTGKTTSTLLPGLVAGRRLQTRHRKHRNGSARLLRRTRRRVSRRTPTA